jgi:hypothetical protein
MGHSGVVLKGLGHNLSHVFHWPCDPEQSPSLSDLLCSYATNLGS